MVFNAFFPWGVVALLRVAVPPMTVCLPVRMGTECLRLDACAGSGADGACTVELRVNGVDVVREGGGVCCLTENECKQQKKVLSVLFRSVDCGGTWEGGGLMELIWERERPLCDRRWNYSSLQ